MDSPGYTRSGTLGERGGVNFPITPRLAAVQA